MLPCARRTEHAAPLLNAPPIRLLFATPECAPLVKTGGLGEVSAALPAALLGLGVDVRLLLPGYSPVLEALPDAREVASMPARDSFPPTSLLAAQGPHGVPLLVLDCPALYRRPGGPYLNPEGRDWPDNALRFGLLARAAADLGCDASPLRWRADVVHCNEWHTGLAPAYLHYAPGARAASVITIHNLAFQGNFAPEYLPALGLPASSFSVDGLEYHGRISFLKAALHYADAITTVSPTYAREIQNESLGFGFHGVLSARRDALTGILNGIDTELWDPSTDALIPQRYDANSLAAKRVNKRALQQRMGLAGDDSIPVLGVVSRLAHQKGLDLLLQLAPRLAALPAQLAIQGVGDDEIQREFVSLAQRHPGKIAVSIEFDEALAHLIEAGADMFLMPSRFEPCGMNQMYSQRYGTPPVVHATGGLADSVVDCNPSTLADGSATGFVCRSADAVDFLHAVARAAAAWHDPATWTALQRNGMARDFGWGASAARYLDIYRRLAAPARPAARGGFRPMP